MDIKKWWNSPHISPMSLLIPGGAAPETKGMMVMRWIIAWVVTLTMVGLMIAYW